MSTKIYINFHTQITAALATAILSTGCSTSKEINQRTAQTAQDAEGKSTEKSGGKANQENAKKANDKTTTQISTTKPSGTRSGTKETNETSETNESGEQIDKNAPIVPPTNPISNSPSGEAFFTTIIEPLFQASCKSCHTEPRLNPDAKGPLTVFSYMAMKSQVIDGSGSINNKLMDKVRGSILHGGGDQCRGSTSNSPCKEIAEWWKLEKSPMTTDSGARIGRLLEVTPGGRVLGWAVNPKNLDEQVMVKFYVGGPKETGMAAGTTTAFVNGEDEGTPGFHAFSAELPPQFRNGKPGALYVYAVIGGIEQAIHEGAFTFTAWAPTAAGQTYFTNTVRPALNSCNSCHGGKTYAGYYASLFIQPPNKGGTATNNELINKVGGLNGVTHSGGNACGGNVTASPCSLLQTWWQMEFAAP